jgi:hypothetical protein
VLNFTRSGDFEAMRFLFKTVPFLNARIQGLSRLHRGYQDNPRMFLLKGSMLAAATLALLMRNNDREEYEELPEWDKDTYWHLFLNPRGTSVGDGDHIRIPKPFEVGVIFGTMPERFARGLTGRDDYKVIADAAHRAIADTFAFNPIPQLVKPPIEQFANRTFFFDAPIVGLSEEGKIPEAQYSTYTSETFRLIAEAMPDFAPAWLRSPVRLEAAFNGYLSSTGGYLLSASDALVRRLGAYPEMPESRLYDIRPIGRFVRDPTPRSTKYNEQLYDMLNEANQVFRTVNEYRRQQRLDEAAELLAKNRAKLQTRRALNNIATQVRTVNGQIRQVMYSPTMAPEAKRERIDALTERKNAVLRRVAPIADLW